MEKTTKKKKSKKLKRRIGLIAVGGLSLVLTICLSVGATLAWFAGSTWASKDLYMGGPVYVEMAGRGNVSGATTDGTGEGSEKTANWKGGTGSLDIQAAARTTGTVTAGATAPNDILLPGQRLMIYSQARVFSTNTTDSTGTTSENNSSSGANTTNTSGTNINRSTGRKTTTTSAVLRARFSIDVEFDPYMGFNNFTDTTYASAYPKQSESTPNNFATALGTALYDGTTVTRRDAVVAGSTWTNATTASTSFSDSGENNDLWLVYRGIKKSIYQWKYVSEATYRAASTAERMGAPFDGTVNASGSASNKNADFTKNTSGSGNGFYGLWVTDGATTPNKLESAAFYKARCKAYLNTYKETYINENGDLVQRSIGEALTALEDGLNASFVTLINESSDRIQEGHVSGFTVGPTGNVTNNGTAVPQPASWLYIDPTIGNDTNTADTGTQTGGWWYLVSSSGSVVDEENEIDVVTDTITTANITAMNTAGNEGDLVNNPTAGTEFTRADVAKDDEGRLTAKLYEIDPSIVGDTLYSNATISGQTGGTTANVVKYVSVAFPFVNGSFQLPGDALTNVFANAKLTFKIVFQAVQAFFPYIESIDGVLPTSVLAGTEKALNIGNAIPIFNEAFDYQEVNGNTITNI